MKHEYKYLGKKGPYKIHELFPISTETGNIDFLQRSKAVLRNTCASGLLVSKSTKNKYFLKGPRYH